jgi:hypothetical protein
MDNEALFVTTDGVEVWPNQKYWVVSDRWEIWESLAAGIRYERNPTRKYFSTEALAEAFVFDNKPIYSVKDFRELIKTIEERFIAKIPQQ